MEASFKSRVVAAIIAFILCTAGVNLKSVSYLISVSAGVVPEPQGQVEEEGEVLGSQQRHGRVRLVWSHGPPLHPAARVHPQVGQGRRHRVLRPVAPRYSPAGVC